MNGAMHLDNLDRSGLRNGLLSFSGTGALMAELVDGTDGIAIGVSGLDLGVMVGRGNDRFRGRDSPPCAAGFAAIDCVARKVRIGHGLPAQIDRGLRAGIAGCGDGGQTGGDVGRKNIESIDSNGSGELTGELQRLTFHGDAGDALGAILIDLAEANAFVQSAAGLFAGVDKQALFDRLGRRREWALRGLCELVA